MSAPVLVGAASACSNVAGAASSGNSRVRPPPATTGLIISVSSSSSPASIIDRTSDGLPPTPIVPPTCPRRTATKSVTGPLISVLLSQATTESSMVEATYFWVPLIQLANGSSVEVGQYPAHSVNVTRPSSTASCPSSIRDSAAPILSSQAGCHSFGRSTTPSIELNSPAYTLRM